MSSSYNWLAIACALVLFSTQSYAQSFNNIVVDGNSGDQSETSIAVAPSGPDTLMATWNDLSNGSYSQPGYAFSVDSGETWINEGILSQGLNNLSNDVLKGGFDPSCAISKSGGEYYVFVNLDSTHSAYLNNGDVGQVTIEYTNDNGSTWSGPFFFGGTWEDKPYLAVDNSGDSTHGRTYVAATDWNTNKTGSSVYLTYPSNQADLSSSWIFRNLSASSNTTITGAVPTVGPNGTLYVAYDSNATGSTSYICVAMSTNSGHNFTEIAVHSFTGFYKQDVGALRVSSFPTLTVDPKTDLVYLAWTQNDNNGDMNIYFTHSTGPREITSWTTPQIATQTTTNDQFFLWLAINSTGDISLVYYHAESNGNVDVYSAQSYDGQSFVGQNGTGEDVKLTSVSSNPNDGHWASDYIGVTSDNSGEVHALWTDFRSGNEDIYEANYNQRPTVTMAAPYLLL